VISEGEIALRIAVAVVLGALIGLERELSGQVAGLRTHMTIALGSAVFAIASAYSFGEFIAPTNDTNYRVDVTRIASNIVTGVGFLGGGAILKHGASVRGLTTAASIWVCAAVGLAVGLGSFYVAALSTVVLVVVLTALRAPRRWVRKVAVGKETVIIRLLPGSDAGQIVNALHDIPELEVRSLSIRTGRAAGEENATGEMVIHADVKGPDLEERLAGLARREEITDIDIGD
jgi:putative Mg2+ transporter-C (MgtC) family protein